MNQPAHKTVSQNRTFFVPVYHSYFNGKEKDHESGFHYYGARYYWSEVLTGWLSVDPLMDKYPSISSYAYCAWNPIIAYDPDGMDSVHTPNGMANVGDGYRTTYDGLYLYGDGLRTKRWNPNLEVGGVIGERGGYENCDDAEVPVMYNPEKSNIGVISIPFIFSLSLALEDISITVGAAVSTVVSYVSLIPVFALFSSDTRQYATDNSNKEKHGDGGRSEVKAKKQIDQLQRQAQNASRKEREKIKNKITNIKRNAAKKETGEEHSRANKH